MGKKVKNGKYTNTVYTLILALIREGGGDLPEDYGQKTEKSPARNTGTYKYNFIQGYKKEK